MLKLTALNKAYWGVSGLHLVNLIQTFQKIYNSQTVMQFLLCCLAIIIYHLLYSESLSLIEEVSLGSRFLFFTFPFSNLQTRKIMFCIYPCGKKFVFIFPYIKKLCMFLGGSLLQACLCVICYCNLFATHFKKFTLNQRKKSKFYVWCT